MIPEDELGFLAELIAGQSEEDPRVRAIPPQRLAAILRNPSAMTGTEMAALLLSPRVRAAYLAARRTPPEAANDNRYVLRSASFAADDGSDERIVLEADFGTMTVRPGPDEAVPFVVSFQLTPTVLGGVAGRHVTVWETGSCQVWLEGLTDATGRLHAAWPFGGTRPRDRMRDDTLRFALSEDPVP